ncbi:MAG: IS66-like element accessory protein TnpA [Burkholderiales bacterium]
MGGRVEILGAVERRRRWTAEEKVAILDEAFRKGGSVAAASDRHGVSRALIYYWRRQAREGGIAGVGMAMSDNPAAFVPVRIEADPATAGSAPSTATSPAHRSSLPRLRACPIEIALTNGRVIKVDAGVDPEALARLVAVLDGRRR